MNSFDTINVTTMEMLFQKCINLENLNIDNFNKANVTNMYRMFAQCNSIVELDLVILILVKLHQCEQCFICVKG